MSGENVHLLTWPACARAQMHAHKNMHTHAKQNHHSRRDNGHRWSLGHVRWWMQHGQCFSKHLARTVKILVPRSLFERTVKEEKVPDSRWRTNIWQGWQETTEKGGPTWWTHKFTQKGPVFDIWKKSQTEHLNCIHMSWATNLCSHEPMCEFEVQVFQFNLSRSQSYHRIGNIDSKHFFFL